MRQLTPPLPLYFPKTIADLEQTAQAASCGRGQTVLSQLQTLTDFQS
jgi:hypothetical protein